MRRFKLGDKVKAFLDANIAGTIVQIHQVQANQWLAEGTTSVEFLVDVQLKDGRIRRIKMSELHHDDDF
jgi:hypothetical protein